MLASHRCMGLRGSSCACLGRNREARGCLGQPTGRLDGQFRRIWCRSSNPAIVSHFREPSNRPAAPDARGHGDFTLGQPAAVASILDTVSIAALNSACFDRCHALHCAFQPSSLLFERQSLTHRPSCTQTCASRCSPRAGRARRSAADAAARFCLPTAVHERHQLHAQQHGVLAARCRGFHHRLLHCQRRGRSIPISASHRKVLRRPERLGGLFTRPRSAEREPAAERLCGAVLFLQVGATPVCVVFKQLPKETGVRTNNMPDSSPKQSVPHGSAGSPVLPYSSKFVFPRKFVHG